MIDVGIREGGSTFKLRACGIIVQDGKILVDTSKRFNGYVYMGGHIELGENSRDAVVREVREEIGVDTTIIKLIAINENMYTIPTGVAHEIAMYYMLEPKTKMATEDFEYREIDKGEEKVHYYKWIELSKAKEYNIQPGWVVDYVLDGCENKYCLTDRIKNITY